MSKKGLLVVSFGTSHGDTQAKTIDKIELRLDEAFPDRTLYRAWTSGMIIRKLKSQGTEIDTVGKALLRMEQDGITDVLVQPTHILNGVENDIMLEEIRNFSNRFDTVRYSSPLLTCKDDNRRVTEIIADKFSYIAPDTALILMGHGTSHYVNPVYAALDYQFKDMGRDNFYVATVEAYPALENAVAFLHKRPEIKNVVITPFMIVAGDHAKNDMAGNEKDSWKSILKNEGYAVECVVKGLGEYDEICDMFVDHAREAERGAKQEGAER